MKIATNNTERKRKGSMKLAGLCLAFSVALHLSLAVLLVSMFSSIPRPLQTIVADLTLAKWPEERKKAVARPNPWMKGTAGGKAGTSAKGGGTVPPRESAGSSPVADGVPAEPQPAHVVSVQGPPVIAGQAGERTVPGGQGGAGAGQGSGSGSSGIPGGKGTGPTGPGTGQGGSGNAGLQGGSDYYYIRDHVMRNVAYPERARRMGMEGRVLLSFIVIESGATRDVKVLHTSGFRLLDESAKEAVEKTVIPKKVPYRVAVTLPITYKMQ
jgi:periplasmic protein TonB